MKIQKGLLAAFTVVVATVPQMASADTFSMFFDGGYVDVGNEGTNMRNDLIAMGHTVNTFTGITNADFTAATTGVDMLIFPEMELDDLATDLDAATISTISNFVLNGGCLLQANAFQSNASLPNALFGWSITQVGSIGPTSLNVANAVGTPFAGGPAVLSDPSAVEGFDVSSLPGGGLSIYDDGSFSSVFVSQVGSGHYIYLGFDWFDNPTPDDWTDVTKRALEYCVVPEPATMAALGLGGLALIRRRRKV